MIFSEKKGDLRKCKSDGERVVSNSLMHTLMHILEYRSRNFANLEFVEMRHFAYAEQGLTQIFELIWSIYVRVGKVPFWGIFPFVSSYN